MKQKYIKLKNDFKAEKEELEKVIEEKEKLSKEILQENSMWINENQSRGKEIVEHLRKIEEKEEEITRLKSWLASKENENREVKKEGKLEFGELKNQVRHEHIKVNLWC